MKPSLLLLVLAAWFGITTVRADEPEASLYRRLGGEPVVTAVVVQTLETMVADPRVNQSFEGVNLKKLETKIVQHLCEIADGGCHYAGEDMKRAHEGMNIGQREFYAMVEALRVSLDANGVGEREKNELLRLLAPMKRDVVSR